MSRGKTLGARRLGMSLVKGTSDFRQTCFAMSGQLNETYAATKRIIATPSVSGSIGNSFEICKISKWGECDDIVNATAQPALSESEA